MGVVFCGEGLRGGLGGETLGFGVNFRLFEGILGSILGILGSNFGVLGG